MARPKRTRPVGHAPPRLDAELLARVEAWRQAEAHLETQKAAVEHLLDLGLSALPLLRDLANAKIDGDVDDKGEEIIVDGNDDEIDAYYSAIRSARAILWRT
jgi:hypothetical protein